MHVEKETPKREWVSPCFEQQPLKDALAGGTIPSGDGVGYS
jgi:hypothetical protein